MSAEIESFIDEYNLVTITVVLSETPHLVTMKLEYEGEPADISKPAELAAIAFRDYYNQQPESTDAKSIQDTSMISVKDLKIGMSGILPNVGLHVDSKGNYWISEEFPVHLKLRKQSGMLTIERADDGLHVYGVDPEAVRVSDRVDFDRPVLAHP